MRHWLSQAREAMHTIVTGDLSKYNLAPAFVADESERADIVLVVDQTFNDMSVTYGNAGPGTSLLPCWKPRWREILKPKFG